MAYNQVYRPTDFIQPIGAQVEAIGHKMTDGVRSFLKNNDEWNDHKKKMGDDAALKNDFYSKATKLLEAKGIDPASVSLPVPTDQSSPEEYVHSVGTTVGQVMTIDKLEKQGVDTKSLKDTMQFPELFVKEAQNLLSTHVGKQVTGQYGPEVYAAVQAGKMSRPEIEQKYGVTLDEDSYNKMAGIDVPQPIAGPFQSSTDHMAAVKSAAAKQQPMTQQQAMLETPISEPQPYTKAIQTVAGAGMTEDQNKALQPIISAAANRSTADVYNKLQTPTEAGFVSSKLATGEPVDAGTTALAGAIRSESTTFNKKKDLEVRKMAHDVDLLRIYMNDHKQRKDLERAYGKDALSAVDDMYKVIKERSDVDQLISQAQNWTSLDKPAPDVSKLIDKGIQLDNQIDILRSRAPRLSEMAASIGSAPTKLYAPEIQIPGASPDRSPPPPKAGARKPLSAFEK